RPMDRITPAAGLARPRHGACGHSYRIVHARLAGVGADCSRGGVRRHRYRLERRLPCRDRPSLPGRPSRRRHRRSAVLYLRRTGSVPLRLRSHSRPERQLCAGLLRRGCADRHSRADVPPCNGFPVMKLLILAVVAMLFQQALAYMSSLVMPVAAPAVAADLNLNPALVGVVTGIVFTGSMISQVSCGGFIIRFGPLRMSQVSLVISGSALTAIMSGLPAIFAVAAFVMGLGTAPSTPASSQILSRYSPPRYAPLIFSVKQTGVPVGAMTAGVLVPFCVATFGWRGAFAVSGLMCLGYALLLQPLRKEFDRDRKPGYSLSPSDVGNLLRAIITTSELRTMAVAAFA